jgi:type II secretory pathway component GspD/PulD (secretin)
MKEVMLAGMLGLLVIGWAGAEDPSAALTRGKLEADLGHSETAAAAFSAVLETPEATTEQRWEALIRLAVTRREAGDVKGSVDALEEAWRKYGKDPGAVRLLVQAVGSPLPGLKRWQEISDLVRIDFDRSVPAKPTVRVVWPGVSPSLCPCKGHPVSFDFVDANLQDVFRMIADISGENVVVNPRVQGTVTIKVEDRPWDEVLERMLAPNGYIARHEGNVVYIMRPEDAPARRTFAGRPIDFDYQNADLLDVLREVAAHGGATVEIPEGVGGRVYFKLVHVPWDQAFDMVANTNGLTWTRDGDVIHVAIKGRSDRPMDLEYKDAGLREVVAIKGLSDRSMDFNYTNADLRDVLREVAAHGGASVEIPEGVGGRVMLRLSGVPWDRAFDMVAKANGLTWTRHGNVIRVAVRGHDQSR